MTENKKTDRKVQKANVAKASKEVQGGRTILTRGKTFEGVVIKKFPKRLAIQFERNVYVPKYERYAKSKTKVHARLPESMEKDINIGDLIQVRECRPLSKIIHFMVIKKIKDAKETEENSK